MGTPNNSGASEKAGTTTFPNFKMPNIDMNAIMESYKKNLEVLGLINKMSIEVCNGITKLQSAFIKQMMTDMGSVWEKANKPSDMMTKFNEVTRDTVEKAIGNSKQISEMIVSTNKELSAAITKRVKDCVEEAKNIVNKK
ncbi:MAG: TIGR01841 family phasin [Alphaproteobacteria bacterium]|nr:TIGR01841 family phasin [Alphaproteobacteria bacterium]